MPVPPFVRNLRAPIVKEFERLAKQKKWDKLKDSEDEKLRDKYWAKRSKFIGKAVVENFTRLYEKDKTDMEAWRRLLRDLGEKKSPRDPEDGEKKARRIYINIVQFMDVQAAQTRPADERPTLEIFKTRKDLAEWTVENDLLFPLKTAKANKFLKSLLIHLSVPRPRHNSPDPPKMPKVKPLRGRNWVFVHI